MEYTPMVAIYRLPSSPSLGTAPFLPSTCSFSVTLVSRLQLISVGYPNPRQANQMPS